MKKEQWKPIEGFEKYEVSSFGRIRSLQKSKIYHLAPIVILKQFVNNQGFSWVCLYNSGRIRTQKYVHRIVANSFFGKPEPGQQVNHKDFDRTNNRIDNLEYVSPKENTAHKVKHRRHIFGEQVWSHKLREVDVRHIRFLRLQHIPVRKIARRFKMDLSHIYRILRRDIWKYI